MAQVDALAAETRVKGSMQNRGDADTGQDLWDLSLLQEQALERANGDKVRMRDYVRTLAAQAKEVDKPKCSWRPWRRCPK